jgi:hypothetical protein
MLNDDADMNIKEVQHGRLSAEGDVEVGGPHARNVAAAMTLEQLRWQRRNRHVAATEVATTGYTYLIAKCFSCHDARHPAATPNPAMWFGQPDTERESGCDT